MAHGDYSCCAICDCKLCYGEDATKEELCTDCLKNIRDKGYSFLDVYELLAGLRAMPIATAKELLTSLGYRECYYLNEFDESVKDILANKEAQDDKA